MSIPLIINSGDVFGLLTIIKEDGKNKHGRRMFLCRCQCGNTSRVVLYSLVSKHTTSCGCIVIPSMKKSKITHNSSYSSIYRIWASMRSRCSLSTSVSYKHYGGRGISVCDEWEKSFPKFKSWSLKNGYKEGLSIERKNVNGNYCPDNCEWIPRKHQNKNKRNSIRIEYKGKVLPIVEVSKKTGRTYMSIYKEHINKLIKVYV